MSNIKHTSGEYSRGSLASRADKPATQGSASSTTCDSVSFGCQDDRQISKDMTVQNSQTSIKQYGRKRRLPTKDQDSRALRTVPLNVDNPILFPKHKLPIMPRQHLQKRPSSRQETTFRPTNTPPERWDDDSVGQVNQRGKRLCQQSASCCDHDERNRSNSRIISHDFPSPNLSLISEAGSPSENLSKTTQLLQNSCLLTAEAIPNIKEPLSADRSGIPYPLSQLRWPFDEGVFEPHQQRGGGGGGSQPSTTGSQGFPQFVTAGPSMSLFGESIFGYEREELLWA